MRPFTVLAASTCLLLSINCTASALTLSGDYYEDAVQANCAQGLDCTIAIQLNSVSAGKFLHLQSIDCVGSTSPGAPRSGQYFLSDNGLNARRFHGLSLDVPATAGTWTFNQIVNLKIAGGPPRMLHVVLSSGTTTNWSAVCSITGKITSQ